MPFDGITWPDVHVLVAPGGTTDPGAAYLHLGVGPGLGTGLLGGPTFTDITNDVTSASIKRGRDSDIDSATPGTCTLVVDNRSGDYDPTNLLTPFWGPNLLTTQQESLEDGTTTGWQAGLDTSIANTAAQAYHGTKALQLTKTVGTGTAFAQAGTGVTGVPFPPSAPCRLSVWFRTPVTARSCKIRAAFHTMSGTYLSGQDLLSAAVTDSTTGWVQATVIGRSPAQSTRIVPELQVAGAVNTESHYADQIVIQQGGIDAGAQVKVRAEWPIGTVYDRFTGTVADVALDMGYDPTVTFTCSDGLETLGRAQLAMTAPSFDGDTTGARIGHVADQAAWPTSLRALDTGYSTLGPTILGDFALNLMRKVEGTEFGLLFCDGSNILTFYDRHRSATATRSTVVQASFTDTQGASEIEMASLDVAKNRDRLVNDVHITRDPDPMGQDVPIEQVATDLESVTHYGGTFSMPIQLGLVCRDDYQALAMAQGLLPWFRDTVLRIREVKVEAITQGQWAVLLPLTLLDLISLSRDYGPVTVTAQLLIQALAEEIRFDPDPAWNWTFTMSNLPPSPDLWVLGTSAIGAGRLGW